MQRGQPEEVHLWNRSLSAHLPGTGAFEAISGACSVLPRRLVVCTVPTHLSVPHACSQPLKLRWLFSRAEPSLGDTGGWLCPGLSQRHGS